MPEVKLPLMSLAIMGWQEWLLIALVVIVIFGAGRLPQVGDALGKGIRNFKKSVTGEDEKKAIEPKKEEEAVPPENDDKKES